MRDVASVPPPEELTPLFQHMSKAELAVAIRVGIPHARREDVARMAAEFVNQARAWSGVRRLPDLPDPLFVTCNDCGKETHLRIAGHGKGTPVVHAPPTDPRGDRCPARSWRATPPALLEAVRS